MFRSPSHLLSAASSSAHSSPISSNPASPMEPDFGGGGGKSTFEQLLEAEAQGLKEERFRIDRKKLEDMIQTPPAPQGFNGTENADVFFQRVMLETSTQISWPSKLKIGAKSKKDPHVKVVGQPEAVQMAKEQILEILDTKKDRVTLKMDVSYSDHSYVIGKGGFKIQQVMEETGCHIHFPDSNRSSSSAAEKSNQVSVAGQAAGVELARAKIRDLLPLEFSFELPVGQQPVKPGDECSPAIQHIQQTYSFNVSFRPLGLGRTLLLVRGCQRLLPRLRQGLALLMEYLTGSKAIPVMGFMQTEIAAQHQPFVQGPCNANTQTIMNKTGARILFPEPPPQFGCTLSSPGGPHRSKSTVVIQGSFDGVCLAWQELLKHLPMVLMFDLKEGQELDPVMVNSYMEAFSISIMVRPKIKDNTKSVLIRGAEKDSRILFQIRKEILGLEDDSSSTFKQTTSPHFPTTDTFRRHSDFKEPGTDHLTAESLSILSSILHPQVLGLLNKLPHHHPRQPPPYGRMIHHNRHFPTRSVESWIDRNRDFSAGGAPDFLSKDGRPEDGDSGIFLSTSNRFFGGGGRFESTKSELSSRAESSASSCSSSNDTPDSRFAGRSQSTDVHDLLADYGGKRLAANQAMRQSVEGGVRRPSHLWSGCGFSKSTPGRAKESGSISEFLETDGGGVEPAKPWAAEKNDNPLEQVPSPFGLSNFWEHLPRLPPVDYSSVRSLDDLLLLVDLESYMEVFWHNEIDLTIFLTLTEMDLQQLNISYGARRKMLTAISAVREQLGDWSSRTFLAAPGAERKKFPSSRSQDSARVEEQQQIAAPLESGGREKEGLFF